MIKNYLNYFKLNNKKAFLFGGCGLIGEKTVEALLSTGAEVISFDINKKKGKHHKRKFAKEKFHYSYFDISETKTLNKKFNSFIIKYGCPDIFINSSYPTSNDWRSSSFKNNKISILKKNVDIHLNSHSWLAYLACENMKKFKKKGSVIIFSSIYGVLGQNTKIYKGTKIQENMNYSIIKGGLTNFSRQLASYYGKFDLRVNAICPGGVMGQSISNSKSQNKKFIKNYSSQCPLNRLAKPEEIASSVLFLSSDASSYISGSTFMVDGGWSAI